MKSATLTFLLAVALTFCNAQEITLTGTVDAPQTGSRIIFSGAGITLNKVSITCNELVIDSFVTMIVISGDVKITCKKVVNNLATAIRISATTKSSLTIDKPLRSPDIPLNNTSAQFVEIKWRPTEDNR